MHGRMNNEIGRRRARRSLRASPTPKRSTRAAARSWSRARSASAPRALGGVQNLSYSDCGIGTLRARARGDREHGARHPITRSEGNRVIRKGRRRDRRQCRRMHRIRPQRCSTAVRMRAAVVQEFSGARQDENSATGAATEPRPPTIVGLAAALVAVRMWCAFTNTIWTGKNLRAGFGGCAVASVMP